MRRRFSCLCFLPGLLLTMGAAVAQTNSTADRTTPSAPARPDGFVVKTLRTFGPFERTPLTEKQRFRMYIASTIGFAPIAGEALSAGISQGLDNPHEWGQGMAGYGKRFGSNLAYNAVRQTIAYGLSVPLHEDNRYFASGRRTVPGRVLYALISPVMAHKPDGHATFSFSQAAGIAGTVTISNYWYPPSWRGPSKALQNAGYTYLGTSAGNLFREFVPDIIRWIQR